ncbi:MAG: T9SS type A sorting domain-containing protein [Bacteroidetes bacterium]|nr:T9SS type A sorting domain-containing protein [Bacteroidota bacterium]
MRNHAFVILFLLSANVSAYNWIPLGPDTAGVNNICFETSADVRVICTDEGIYIDDIIPYQEWSFYSYGLPVWDAESHTDSTILLIIGDGSWSDGIWIFNLNTHQWYVAEWAVFPNFLEYCEVNGKYYAGFEYGLLESDDGTIWTQVAGFTNIATAFDSWGDHIVFSDIGSENHIYHSDDGGLTWDSYLGYPGFITDLSINNDGTTYFIVNTGKGSSSLLSSTDFGQNWNTEFESGALMSDVGFDAMGNIFIPWNSARDQEEGVAWFDPMGGSLISLNDGLPNLHVNRLVRNNWMSSIHIFACTESGAYHCYDYLTFAGENLWTEWKVYPNPLRTGNELIIEFPLRTLPGKVCLFSFDGKLVLEEKVTSTVAGKIRLMTNLLPPGIYFLQMYTWQLNSTSKIILY